MTAFFLLWLDKLSRWIRDVLSDDGNQSSMRLVLLAAWACVLGVWTILSLYHRAMQPVDTTVLTLLGLPTAGKLVQTHFEARPV